MLRVLYQSVPKLALALPPQYQLALSSVSGPWPVPEPGSWVGGTGKFLQLEKESLKKPTARKGLFWEGEPLFIGSRKMVEINYVSPPNSNVALGYLYIQ